MSEQTRHEVTVKTVATNHYQVINNGQVIKESDQMPFIIFYLIKHHLYAENLPGYYIGDVPEDLTESSANTLVKSQHEFYAKFMGQAYVNGETDHPQK